MRLNRGRPLDTGSDRWSAHHRRMRATVRTCAARTRARQLHAGHQSLSVTPICAVMFIDARLDDRYGIRKIGVGRDAPKF